MSSLESEVVPDDDFDLQDTGGSLPSFDVIPLDLPKVIQFFAIGIVLIIILLALIYGSWRHYAPSLEAVRLMDEVKLAKHQDEEPSKSKKKS
mmetsp:Transcript_7775/g.15635  ORF Transcript_7775/g.15635 Transcript_7775/m.15635 type:complete len:92 (-) Transcript_7775:133-408(-)|eukprot:CAMPEP_0196726400 /NCGR_PEP_ID=MMETSP1091-20130531/7685_1 /TAXON_ID=302021 /ORGANISM="Rhodomonas sp., Strain CCMP768" /LENGTH=91 /DNA_ID=CAMNT_0042068835 /DNA_START=24 /DNA_END=299 /DNA_ORIENTATION=-